MKHNTFIYLFYFIFYSFTSHWNIAPDTVLMFQSHFIAQVHYAVFY